MEEIMVTFYKFLSTVVLVLLLSLQGIHFLDQLDYKSIPHKEAKVIGIKLDSDPRPAIKLDSDPRPAKI